MLIAEFDIIKILPFAAFGMFAAIAWLVMEMVTAKNSRAEQRLDEFKDPKQRKKKELES